MKWFTLTSAAFLLCSVAAKAQIYADFQTSMGDFTCELNYTVAPKTVANFVSLAEGTRKWVSPSGAIQENKPFYNGLIFHRVVGKFMNQAGCPLGTGGGGPGYHFPDETSGGPAHAPYVISMANATGYTNGSQFFVTVPRDPAFNFQHLDGTHTVFGVVTSGRDVVDQINAVPVTNWKPNTPVVLQSVTIRRVGTAAAAFDVHAQNLPELQLTPYDLEMDLPTVVRAVPRVPRDERVTTSTYVSEDLQTWDLASQDYAGLGGPGNAPFPIAVPYGFGQYPEKQFYRFVDAVNSDAFIPASLSGKTLTVNWPGNSLVFTFNAAGDGGTAVFNGESTPRDILYVYESQSPYDLIVEVSGLVPLKVSASLTGSTSTLNLGTHKLSGYTDSWFFAGQGSASITK